MKNYYLLFIGLLLFAFSCQDKQQLIEKDAETGSQVNLKAYIEAFNHYNGDEFLPADLKCNGKPVTKTLIIHDASGTMGVTINEEYCSDYTPSLQFFVEGEGHATHLGLFSVLNLACVDIYSNFLTPVYGFLTAANGDEVHTQMGFPYPDVNNPPNMYYPYTIIGGTGRFDGATGNILMYGIVDYNFGTWEFTGEGEITY